MKNRYEVNCPTCQAKLVMHVVSDGYGQCSGCARTFALEDPRVASWPDEPFYEADKKGVLTIVTKIDGKFRESYLVKDRGEGLESVLRQIKADHQGASDHKSPQTTR